ncbi:MAG TPA: triose-phosphate isomerase [bacterium]|nr:triose-phosphate isomerase [bacterium]HOL48403.1 triose-phosphate isomerase [bacterium]HPQ18883.1 triose-phosphate isomerase [bacterium]
MKKPLIAGNWKMYTDLTEARKLAIGIKNKVVNVKEVEIVLCPPFVNLLAVYEIIKDTNIKLGAQNLYFEKYGAYTGEINGEMLLGVGCSYVIIGHSERRQYFKESDELLNKKLKAALRVGLTPIFCIGETLEEREKNITEQVIEKQVKEGFKDISKEEMQKIVIAYEPVWAIGTGKTATPQQAQEVHKFIRELITKLYNEKIALEQIILYGGSVKPDNIKGLMAEKDIDGALVGGASLKIDDFVKIIKFYE